MEVFTDRHGSLETTLPNPAVSWLLCSHVVNDQLKLAIDSCLLQTFSDFELVVVANGDSALIVANTVQEWYRDDRRVRVFFTPIRHLPFSLSLGLHHARAPLIARMDSDDISYPDRLERQVAFMSQNHEVAILGTSYKVIDDVGHELKNIRMPESDQAIRRGLLRGNPLCHPSVMFRRQVVMDSGGYLGALHAEDYELWARLSLDPKVRFANLPHICLGYRVLGVGIARRSRFAYAAMASAQFKIFLVGGGLRWCFAAFLSVIKLLVRSTPIRSMK